MADLDVGLIVMMVVTIVLLFISMILSAISSAAAVDCKCSDPKAHNYSMYSALVTGLSALLIGIALAIYIYRGEIANNIGSGLVSAGTGLQSKFKLE